MIHKVPDTFDSKFRFILVAADRAKQIQNGAPPKVEARSRKPAFLAIKETELDLVPYAILEEAQEEFADE